MHQTGREGDQQSIVDVLANDDGIHKPQSVGIVERFGRNAGPGLRVNRNVAVPSRRNLRFTVAFFLGRCRGFAFELILEVAIRDFVHATARYTYGESFRQSRIQTNAHITLIQSVPIVGTGTKGPETMLNEHFPLAFGQSGRALHINDAQAFAFQTQCGWNVFGLYLGDINGLCNGLANIR